VLSQIPGSFNLAPSWSATSLSTGTRATFHPQLHQCAPTASERQTSASLFPIYLQTDAQPRPHTLPIHGSATPQAALFGAVPTPTGGCRLLILGFWSRWT
jgi:hypothetical protein